MYVEESMKVSPWAIVRCHLYIIKKVLDIMYPDSIPGNDLGED